MNPKIKNFLMRVCLGVIIVTSAILGFFISEGTKEKPIIVIRTINNTLPSYPTYSVSRKIVSKHGLKERMSKHDTKLVAIMKKYNIFKHLNLARALITEESSWDENATNWSAGRIKSGEPAGGAGLAQFIPATAKRYGLVSYAQRIDPQISLEAFGRYMRDLDRKYSSNQKKMISAYIGIGSKYSGGKKHLKKIFQTKRDYDAIIGDTYLEILDYEYDVKK